MTCGIHLRPFHANHVDSSGGVSRNLSALRTSAASASAGAWSKWWPVVVFSVSHTHITRWCPGAPVFDKRSVGVHITPMSRVGFCWWHIQLVWTRAYKPIHNFGGAPPYCISSKITKKVNIILVQHQTWGHYSNNFGGTINDVGFTKPSIFRQTHI